MPEQHLWEQAVDIVAEWIDETATELIRLLTEGGRTPFGARVSRAEKLAYFRELLFNPDGSVNNEGRDFLMKNYGPQGLAQALTAVARADRRRLLGAPEEDDEGDGAEGEDLPELEPEELIRRALSGLDEAALGAPGGAAQPAEEAY